MIKTSIAAQIQKWAILMAILSLAGCSSFSGFDAKSKFSCKAPDGVLCESMSGIYSTAMQNNLPGQQISHGEKPTKKHAANNKNSSGAMSTAVYSGMPIRTEPKILRLWFAPWEDEEGDLHDQSYVYLSIGSGKWVIEHNQARIKENYRPIRTVTTDTVRQALPGNLSLSPRPANRPDEEENIGIHQGRANNEPNALLSGIATPEN